jgi:methylated-DNA-[protein]-cysteine S-methyltransferase
MTSPIGKIYIAATYKGICQISLNISSEKVFFTSLLQRFQIKPEIIIPLEGSNSKVISTQIIQLIADLTRYFSGEKINFNKYKVYFHKATRFQYQVWQYVRNIPYGSTVTYKEIAEGINQPKASRAVGQANRKNPVPIIIPCHRVIGVNNTLVGFSAGLKVKEWLLRLEQRIG